MSLLVFPSVSIPGVSITCNRTEMWETKIQRSVSGKEWRTTWWDDPVYKLEFQYEFLRNAENYRELHRLYDFISKHAGQWDSFLVEDPEDRFTIDAYLGSGDDTALVPPTFFQLQRVLRASVEGRRDGGENSGRVIINYCTASHRFSDNTTAPWQASVPWSLQGGGSIQDYYATAPDGTQTAARYTVSDAAGRSTYLFHGNIAQVTPTQIRTAGTVTFSVWVRRLSMEGSPTVGLQFSTGSADEFLSDGFVVMGNATAAPHPTDGRAAWIFTLNDTRWTRIAITLNNYDNPSQIQGGGIGWGVFLPNPWSECLVWGGQTELGPRVSKYVPAMDSTVTLYGGAGAEYGTANPPVTPWPEKGDGAMPVYHPRDFSLEEVGEHYPSAWGSGKYMLCLDGGNAPPDPTSLDWQGKRLPHSGFVNFCPWSLDFSQWTKSSGGTGSNPTTATLAATSASDYGDARGPDGSKDVGTAVLFNAGSGTTSGDYSAITISLAHPLLAQGKTYCFSFWGFPWNSPVNDVPPSFLQLTENTSGATVTASLDKTRGVPASRHALVFTMGASASVTIAFRGDIRRSALSQTQLKVLCWGAQVEEVVSGRDYPWHFLPTQAAAVMAEPEVVDFQPNIYKWDSGMHSNGVRLSPAPRQNLSNATWSTGGGDSPDNPTGTAVLPSGGGSLSSGSHTASAITVGTGGNNYTFSDGALLCSSMYIKQGPASTVTFGLKLDGSGNTANGTIDFDPSTGLISRAGTRVMSAYCEFVWGGWWRLVAVTQFKTADSTLTPYVNISGSSIKTYFHMVELGRFPGSPFLGPTWEGDYTILTGPSANHLTAKPGLVLFPGDLDWIPAADPPKLGVFYTWTGGYHKQARFDSEEITAERIFDRIWTVGSVPLITVKP